jgi:hypothetical protein
VTKRAGVCRQSNMQTNTARATASKSERSSGQMLKAVFLRRFRSSDVVPEGAFDIF